MAEPSSMVSSRPRACSRRSVKMWPRSGSAPNCASSRATKGVFAHGARHRFGGAEEIARVWRFDPLFAGDQRDLCIALDLRDPVIDLARQQAQRKADRAAGMAAHPFDGEVGLAGVGGAKHRAHRWSSRDELSRRADKRACGGTLTIRLLVSGVGQGGKGADSGGPGIVGYALRPTAFARRLVAG